MKRFFSKSMAILLAVVMVLGLFSTELGSAVQVYAAEVDSEGYIIITTAAELDSMIRNNLGRNFRLGADIDLSRYAYNSTTWTSKSGWEAIGKLEGKPYTGIFDGNGHTIKGLWSYYQGDNQGLFGWLSGATVKNLTVELAADSGIVGSGWKQGALAGNAKKGTTIENVHVVGAGSGSAVYGGYDIGGLVGCVYESRIISSSVKNVGVQCQKSYAGGIAGYVSNNSNITDCRVNNIEVKGTGSDVGGLVGMLNCGSTIKGSNVTYAKVSAGIDRAGGFVGCCVGYYDGNCQVTDSYAKEVSVDANNYGAGGFAGKISGWSNIDNCYVEYADVQSKYLCAGGFAGQIYDTNTVKNCYVLYADVQAKTSYAGGFVGDLMDTLSMSRCFAVRVNVKASHCAGGWVGFISNATVEKSCAYGSAESTAGNGAGGFAGFGGRSVTISNCYAQVNVTANQNQEAGGFIGGTNLVDTLFTINNSYCVSNINVKGEYNPAYTGAFVGKSYIKFTGTNYYDYQVLGPANAYGSGVKSGITSAYPKGNNTATMKTKSTFVGWDFNNIWRIDEGTTYPYFWYMGSIQTEDPTINTIIEGDRTVTGDGIAGAHITVTYPNGGTSYSVVGSAGTWTTVVPSSVNLVKGDVVSAVQQQGYKLASNRVYTTVIGVSKSAPPVINRVMEGDDVITGTGIAGSGITVTLPNGATVSATVSGGGTWTANVPSGVVLSVGQVISAVQLETGKTVSDPATTTVVGNPEVEPGIDVFVENLTTGENFAKAGDTLLYDVLISNNGTASSTWQSAYVTFTLDRAAALQVSSIRINNRTVTSSQYEYDSASNTLTLYLGDIVGGNGVSISFRTTISDNIANINQLVLEAILGSLHTRSIIYKW